MAQTRLFKNEKDDTEEYTVDSRNSLNELNGTDWIKNTASVWYQKGLGKNHPETKYERMHPAPFAFKMVERLLSFFTKPGDMVLDPFSGVGSTLKACSLNNRKGVGIEISKKWVDITRERLASETSGNEEQELLLGDNRKVLKDFPDNIFKLIVTSPPYWGILNKKADHRVKEERVKYGLDTNYSNDANDLGNIDSYNEFLSELGKVFLECYRVLQENGHIAVVVGDFRNKSKYTPYHSDVAQILSNAEFEMKGIIIYVKNSKQLYPYGYPFAYVPNVMHEYILIFRKDKPPSPKRTPGRSRKKKDKVSKKSKS